MNRSDGFGGATSLILGTLGANFGDGESGNGKGQAGARENILLEVFMGFNSLVAYVSCLGCSAHAAPGFLCYTYLGLVSTGFAVVVWFGMIAVGFSVCPGAI
jgi:hypothetical protein